MDIHKRQFDAHFLGVLDAVILMVAKKPHRKGFFSLYISTVVFYALVAGALGYLDLSVDLPVLVLALFMTLLLHDFYFIYKRNSRKKMIDSSLKTIGCRMDIDNFIVFMETGEITRLDYLYKIAAKSVNRQTKHSNATLIPQ